MTPAQAIQTALSQTQKATAALVGEHPVTWGQHVTGKRSATCGKVQGWLTALRENGRPVALAWDADGCRAVPNE